ncbi:hypothetical protein BDP27DRAFT_1233902, partial [Rhodocollybia butyracea]
ASVLAVLARFGYNVDNLDGPKIRSLFNVMTLIAVVHDYFDPMKLWFEATVNQTPHRYEIKRLNPFEPILRNILPFTTFTTSDPSLYLPDSALLALHATCAKVAHLSGAGGYSYIRRRRTYARPPRIRPRLLRLGPRLKHR